VQTATGKLVISNFLIPNDTTKGQNSKGKPMSEKKQKFPLGPLEVVFLAILTPIIYVSTVRLLLGPIELAFYPHVPYESRSISTWMVLLAVLAFDVAWMLSMRSWPLKSIPRRLRIFLTVFVLTLSTSVLTCFVALDILEGCK